MLEVFKMTEIQVQPRALTPRRLEQQETLSSLNQWVAVFKNFYRRCTYYSYFLQPGLTWGADTERGFQAETTGLKGILSPKSVFTYVLEGHSLSKTVYLVFHITQNTGRKKRKTENFS